VSARGSRLKEWLAVQFHDPQKHEGLVQAFCGPGAAGRSITLRLSGLVPDRHYSVTDWDNPSAPMDRSGAVLAAGIEVRAQDTPRQAIVLHYTSP